MIHEKTWTSLVSKSIFTKMHLCCPMSTYVGERKIMYYKTNRNNGQKQKTRRKNPCLIIYKIWKKEANWELVENVKTNTKLLCQERIWTIYTFI